MNCMKNIQSTPIPQDVFRLMTQLYKQIGRGDYYEKIFEKKTDFYSRLTAEENAMAFYQFFVPDFKPITKSRLHQLTLNSSSARTKSEQLFKNIVRIFQKIHYDSYDPFDLNLAETRELVHFLFKDVIEYPRYRLKKENKDLFHVSKTSYRELYEQYLKTVKTLQTQHTV